jgi:hypothetical protein
MLPRLALNNIADRSSPKAARPCDAGHTGAFGCLAPYIAHASGGQRAVAAAHPLWVLARSVSVSPGGKAGVLSHRVIIATQRNPIAIDVILAILSRHVRVIVCWGAHINMGRINAGWIIAAMARIHAWFCGLVVGYLPRNAVCGSIGSVGVDEEESVSEAMFTGQPRPAFVWRSGGNFRPEPGDLVRRIGMRHGSILSGLIAST